MYLEDAGVATRTVNALHKKHIYTMDDVARNFPRKYLDYRKIIPMREAVGKDVPIAGYFESIGKRTDTRKTIISAEIIEESSGEKLHVRWFGQAYQYESLRNLTFQEVVICGKIAFDSKYGYSITNPSIFQLKLNFKPKIIPIYGKIKGVSEENLKKLIKEAVNTSTDPLEEDVVSKSKLPEYKDSLKILHYPKNFEQMEEAQHRIIFNDMLYFTLQLKKQTGEEFLESPYIVTSTNITDTYLKKLPYELTVGQKEAIDFIQNKMKSGERTNVLVQGDVGCGKTTVAFVSMFLMAENGYQCILMAPTAILAEQHYNKLKGEAEKLGFRTGFLSSDLKGKEKKELLQEIKNGEIDFIVGTHSVISKGTEYKNVGLVVTDEEHKFGVLQRDELENKASKGAHVITMSATPIPRTVADIMYGEGKDLCTIQGLPSGRKPIQTAINNSTKVIFEFLEKQINSGRQAYVVCPLINDADEESPTYGLESVEATISSYETYFNPKGIQVKSVTGKMSKDEVAATIDSFKNNECQILISTTVIEVGVDVPNANVIVINNAERFGLAQLHQLRGRVGRGSYQSYCILKSADKQNPRLTTMVSTTDGFEIAKEDLKQRGIGNLIGTKQSGTNRYAELILSMPNLYNSVKKYADWMLQFGYGDKLNQLYEESEQRERK